MDLLNKYHFLLEEIYNKNEVFAIILFGSYSKENVKTLSDLDICVVFNDKTSDDVICDVLSNSSDRLDLVAFHKIPLSLQYEIMMNGKILMNKGSLSEIKYKTLNQWLDFKPILERLYKSRGYGEV